jgi:uncharacterized membrane protein
MTNHALLFTLAAIGIAETVYLIRVRVALKRPICVIGSRCHQVLESQYSKTFGIHNDLIGFIYYLAVAILTAILVINSDRADVTMWGLLLRILVYLASLFSLYLLYLQWRVIKQWCFWCVMSAITVFLMLMIALTTNLIIYASI